MANIETLLKNKSQKEKANIKSKKIAKIKGAKKHTAFSDAEYDIDIVSIVEINGGVQILARAWDTLGNPIGFGTDGSVEIERFNVYNPPVLVNDNTGDIVREWIDDITNETKQRKLKEDPELALRQSLVHTIKVIGKDGSNIVQGKVGNTTSTFYPDAGTGSTTVDGMVNRNVGTGEAWNTLRTSTGTGVDATSAVTSAWLIRGNTTDSWKILRRGIYLFDTSAITDTDTIDSATFSLYGQSKGDSKGITPDINVYASTPASDNALVDGDYLQTGSTAFSSAITYANQTTGAYNDFALNASGLAAVSTTGISKFASRNANYDVANSAPTNNTLTTSQFDVYNADQTGTTNDPKLVVEHTAASGPTNVKSVDGLAIASVKSMNGLAKASIKSINGLA